MHLKSVRRAFSARRAFFAISIAGIFILASGLRLVLVPEVRGVTLTSGIRILADGGVNPPSAPVVSLDNLTYTLTADIKFRGDGVTILRSGVTLDGAGYTLEYIGTHSEVAVRLQYLTNVTIRNLAMTKWDGGIKATNITNLNIHGVSIHDNVGYGIRMDAQCWNASVRGNNINCNWGYGMELSEGSSACICDNNVIGNDDEGVRLVVSSNCQVYGNHVVGNGELGIYVYRSWDSMVRENNVSENDAEGIFLERSRNVTVMGNTVLKNGFDSGIEIWTSWNNTIRDNNVRLNENNGIGLDDAYNNTVSGNTVSNNEDTGIDLDLSQSNTVFSNNVSANDEFGLELDGSSKNTILGNSMAGNGQGGIHVVMSHNNTFYHNVFDNDPQVETEESINFWDAGYPSGGNFWNDYSDYDEFSGPFQNVTGSDGIWDHPLVLDGNNRDNYPMVPESLGTLSVVAILVLGVLRCPVAGCHCHHDTPRSKRRG